MNLPLLLCDCDTILFVSDKHSQASFLNLSKFPQLSRLLLHQSQTYSHMELQSISIAGLILIEHQNLVLRSP